MRSRDLIESRSKPFQPRGLRWVFLTEKESVFFDDVFSRMRKPRLDLSRRGFHMEQKHYGRNHTIPEGVV